MALPKRRHSKARTGNRRSWWKARRLPLAVCAYCQAVVLAHNACPECGYYGGSKVDHTVKEKEKKKE
ncbi:MAG: 50S ribosomal protein L32 [Armatimonadetes bacterium]|nr:50S ribosomal protein L32 [Armatimonadota bacterium]